MKKQPAQCHLLSVRTVKTKAELVFLSPDEEALRQSEDRPQDQGASPVLRRSNRKRKSAIVDMSKGSGSKKKKASPEQAKAIPKLPRTPQAGQDQDQADRQKADTPDLAAMLQAMEKRLASKIEETSKAVNEAVKLSHLSHDALETLEKKVDDNDARIKRSIESNQEAVMQAVKANLKDMVNDQLREAGFDPELSAGMMETPASKMKPVQRPHVCLSGSQQLRGSLPRGVQEDLW